MSGLTFRSLIHFEFIFVYGVRECSNFIILHVAVQFSQHHLWKRLWARCFLCLSQVVLTATWEGGVIITVLSMKKLSLREV